MKRLAAIIAAYFFLFLVAAQAYTVDEILPVNAPIIQEKAIKIMTAEERSTILINDIWKPETLDKIKIGAGGKLGVAKEAPQEPYGWQAFVAQDAIGSGNGGRDAEAYGRL